MITVYGPNGETIQVNKRAIDAWLLDNPEWSLDNPKTIGIDESEITEEVIIEEPASIDTDIGAGPTVIPPPDASSISQDILNNFEKGVYYSGVPNIILNPNWDGKNTQTKYVPAQAAYPGIELIPSYEGDLYLNAPNFNAINIASFQELLEDAGYLSGDYNPGSNDGPTKKAIRAWFLDVNGFRFNSYETGQNNNIDPVQFLGNQINNRFTSALEVAREESAEFSKNVDRGKFLRENLQSAIGNRRDFTNNELNAFRDIANELIDEEIRNNLKMTEYKIKKDFGKIPTEKEFAADEAAPLFDEPLRDLFPEPEAGMSASEEFMNKVEPLFKSFRDRPERAERAEQNFQNVNRSILGGSMRIE